MTRIYALDTTRHIGTIKVSNGQSTKEEYLNWLILLQLAPGSPAVYMSAMAIIDSGDLVEM